MSDSSYDNKLRDLDFTTDRVRLGGMTIDGSFDDSDNFFRVPFADFSIDRWGDLYQS